MNLSDETFGKFQRFLMERSGLFFDNDRLEILETKLAQRLDACEVGSFEDYLRYLAFHEQGELELKALLDVLTVGETYFFRNEAQFDVLKNHVLPEIVKMGVRSIRIWCAGCSTGEEPYSIAIVLREGLPDVDSWNISLVATDINRNSLKAASKAEYRSRAVHLVQPEILNKYFVRHGALYRLSPEIKKMVTFYYHNLVANPYTLDGMQNVDILFCRNVIIYFDQETLKCVVGNMANSLKTGGYFFIGHSETLWGISNHFKAIEFPSTFIYKKLERPSREIEFPHLSIPTSVDFGTIPPIPEIEDAPVKLSKPWPSLEDGHRAFKNKDYKGAKGIFAEYLKENKNDVKTMMAMATVMANMGEYEEAVVVLKNILSKDNIFAPAYYLKGVIEAKRGEYNKAVETFRKMLYSDENLAIGYFYLGNVCRFLGKISDAIREYENCLRILKKSDEQTSVPLAEDMTVGLLLQTVLSALSSVKKK